MSALLEDLDHPDPWGPEASDVRPRLKLLYGSELAEPLPPLSYLIEALGMVDGGGAPHLFAGYGFSGKTVALQSALLSLAAGRGVWGVHLTQPRRVIHVDLEQGDRLTRRRYQRLAVGLGLDLAELGDAIAVAVMPPLSLIPGSEPQWQELMGGRDLILIDSFRAAIPGQDENSADVRGGLDMLGRLSEATGCRAAVIHHARKPPIVPSGASAAFDVRGSGAIFDACDCVYQMGAGTGEPVRVAHTKARSHGEPVDDFALVIEDVPVGDDLRAGLRVSVHGTELIDERRDRRNRDRLAVSATADGARVLGLVQAHPGIGTRELRALLGLSGDRYTRAIHLLGSKIQIRCERIQGHPGRTPARHFVKVD